MALPRGAMGLYLRFVIVVFPDYTHLLFVTLHTDSMDHECRAKRSENMNYLVHCRRVNLL